MLLTASHLPLQAPHNICNLLSDIKHCIFFFLNERFKKSEEFSKYDLPQPDLSEHAGRMVLSNVHYLV